MAAPRTVFLAAVGDVNNPVTWSGTPYHLLQAGRRANLIHEGLDLSVDSWHWKLRRAGWNAAQVGLRFTRPGGYQYSDVFLERLWGAVHAKIPGVAVINCFQLFAPSVVTNRAVEKWFYVDMTLFQLFNDYGIRNSIGARIAKHALAREAEGYRSAAGVICHSKWAARSMTEHYNLPESKIHVVVPGASVDLDAYARWEREFELKNVQPFNEIVPLKLICVGKYWRRKGLDRLLVALEIARRRGANIILRVIGCERRTLPAELQQVDGVEWLGFMDKRAGADRFLDAVSECDIGCQLSRAEAGGIAQREFHALGLPVLGTGVGGASEHRIRGASIEVGVDASNEEIAHVLFELARNPERVSALKVSAWESRREALWPASVMKLQRILESSVEKGASEAVVLKNNVASL